MFAILRGFFLLTLMSVLSMLGCGNANSPAGIDESHAYHVVTMSDLHFNPLYDASLYSTLVASDPTQWASIYQGSKLPPVATGGGTDTNYPLLVLTLASMKQKMGTSPVVLITGDLLGHNIPQNFYKAYYKKADYPTPDASAVVAMQQFIDYTVKFIAAQIRLSAANVPVIYAVGNIDTYGAGVGPDSTFLANNAGTVYTQFLGDSVEQSTFLWTFTSGGYYSAQPMESKLMVIGLNTNSFVAGAPSDTNANAELAWLNVQLGVAQALGEKVWILMHVPPGANSQQIAKNVSAPNQVTDETLSMMWDPAYQTMFMRTLAEYPGVVTLMLAGHTHMDEYRILPTGDVLEQLPGISPCFGNNPAFKVLTIAKDTLGPIDYESFYYDLSTMPTHFSSLYRLSAAYGATGPLNSSLQQLYPLLVGNTTQRASYINYYASATTALIPGTQVPWNPINGVNWPIFACTVGNADERDYMSCLNGD